MPNRRCTRRCGIVTTLLALPCRSACRLIFFRDKCVPTDNRDDFQVRRTEDARELLETRSALAAKQEELSGNVVKTTIQSKYSILRRCMLQGLMAYDIPDCRGPIKSGV